MGLLFYGKKLNGLFGQPSTSQIPQAFFSSVKR